MVQTGRFPLPRETGRRRHHHRVRRAPRPALTVSSRQWRRLAPAATVDARASVRREVVNEAATSFSQHGDGTPGELTRQIAEQLGIDATTGVVVLSVDNDGPAGRAGIRPGDVLETMEGVELPAPEKLLAELRNRNPGDTVGFKVKRGDQNLDLKAELTERPRGQ